MGVLGEWQIGRGSYSYDRMDSNLQHFSQEPDSSEKVSGANSSQLLKIVSF